MTKCTGAEWCAIAPREGETICLYHERWPCTSSWEREHRDAWDKRVRALQKTEKDAAKKAAASDAKLQQRGR